MASIAQMKLYNMFTESKERLFYSIIYISSLKNVKIMNIVLPCFQKFIDLLFESKQIRKNIVARKYSSVDITPPLQESPRSEFDQPMPNNYSELTDADIFVMPDADADTDIGNTFGNLLIHKCRGGSFVIMRSLENVYIDGCQNGFVFIGPCHSTLFIRNCKNMKIRAIAQQLRVQNSENIEIQAIVGVKPVLEDCKSIKFRSLACRMYQDLVWQIQKAKIDLFANEVYECYDFTPKKQSNFCNEDNTSIDNDFDAQWQAKIQMNDLDWGFKNIYLPQFTSVKKSLLKKVFNQKQLKQNNNIVGLFTKMHFKQFLGAINCSQLSQNFTIIKRIKAEQGLKVLKDSNIYGQKIPILDQRPGNWYFLIVNLKKPIKKAGMGVVVIQERNIICSLFNNSSN